MSRINVENLIAVLRSHVPHCAKLDGYPRCSSDCEHDPELADELQALLDFAMARTPETYASGRWDGYGDSFHWPESERAHP